jgi:large conductance mechanosensitive channel
MTRKLTKKTKEGGILKEFRAFIDRGNLVQLAVAFILGATFASVVTSLVKDIVMPAVGLATGGVDFSNLFVVIKDGFVVKAYSKVTKPKAPTTKDCPFCTSAIPVGAKRCPLCTSELPAEVKA